MSVDGNILLVEGRDDLFAVQGLMRHHTEWEEDTHPVHIHDAGSVVELLSDGVITGKVKASGRKAVGVILDADFQDECVQDRWKRIRQLCQQEGLYPELPGAIPTDGYITSGLDAPRFGVWIMPDNQNEGMLETFLSRLISDKGDELLNLACQSVAQAKEIGTPFIDSHKTKAEIHTYLAWQDPPGKPFGHVLKAGKSLDPKSPAAEPFVKWFIELFELPKKA